MILASASPRRADLLKRAGYEIVIEPADIDESRMPGESPVELVERLATDKAHAAHEAHVAASGPLSDGEVLIAADTIVWTNDDVLGKPKDADDARRMLRELSQATHHVSTGVCLIVGSSDVPVSRSFVETTAVTFLPLSDKQIDAYVASGEPMDKAGSYGIQGKAGAFVSSIEGDYDNVVGLPIARVCDEIARIQGGKQMTAQSVTQIPGILAAHATNEAAGTGCTVILCPDGATGAVDVRGGAPATRETDLLRPEETVQVLHAVVLSGGSAYGLAASCGVAEELERAGIGLDVGVGIVPIVSGACVFDLAVGDARTRPTSEDGARATKAALLERTVEPTRRTPLERGNVGAGTGCSVGKLAGPKAMMKTGVGEAVRSAGALVCGAVAVVNACGDVVDPSSGKLLAGLLHMDGKGNGTLPEKPLTEEFLLGSLATMPLDRTNTTISCVVTNARLTKAQATKVAQMAADAYAHAIRPVHTTNDGDTVFVMATGEVDTQVDVAGVLATQALENAIADAALSATPAYGLPARCDMGVS